MGDPMVVRKKKALALVGVGLVVTGVLSATPALAEGSWGSSMSGARPGFQSRSWQDSHRDHNSTRLALSGCSYPGQGGLVNSIAVTLYDEYGLLPDQAVGNRSVQPCGTLNWGEQTRSDGYHWTIFALNNSTSSSGHINVSALTLSY
jgi:hypothetical protein